MGGRKVIMATSKKTTSRRPGRSQRQALSGLVSLFESRGWLNRRLKVSRSGISYRVFCSVTQFEVYRINENAHVKPGVPGWPVCTVGSAGRVFHDSALSPFPSAEPGPEEWLRCLSAGDFKILAEPA
jgi:hypothetical protein